MTTLPRCPERLTESQITAYREQGYLAFAEVLSPAEVEQACAAIAELVRGRVGQPYQVQFEPGFEAAEADDAVAELKVRKLMGYERHHPHFSYLCHRHPRLRAVLEALLGAAPVLFQDMALIKPPLIGSEKPWHQDDAYFATTPLDAVMGIWIALDHATVANGCMEVIPGGHRDGPRKHWKGPVLVPASPGASVHVPGSQRDCQIVPNRLDLGTALPVELPAGGALFFSGLLPHRTAPNASPQRRRALQFHYHAARAVKVDRDTYNRVFSDHGEPASCAVAGETL